MGPATSTALKIWVRMPCTMEAMVITVATPITTPRIVRPERSLLFRIVSRAMTIPSRTLGMLAMRYSARSAVMGSSLAARAAGYTPKTMPVAAPRARATPTDQRVTRAGSGVRLDTT